MAGLSITEVNAMDYEEFIKRFGNVIEYCPVVAAAVWSQRPFSSARDIHTAVTNILAGFQLEVQAGVLRCHPDLAGRLASTGALSAESTNEQRQAGLLDATESERSELNANNLAYRQKFGFPFVICVRENKKEAIMSGVVERLENSREEEVKKGIEEVKKIGWIRICDIIDVASKANL